MSAIVDSTRRLTGAGSTAAITEEFITSVFSEGARTYCRRPHLGVASRASRFMAAAFGFFIFSQSGDRPDRYRDRVHLPAR
jgi:hypothetical protein